MWLHVSEACEEMVAGFLEAMIWVEMPVTDDPHDPDYDKTLEELGYSVWDVSDEARAAITADCEKFIDLMIESMPEEVSDDLPWRQIGMDFYFTRNDHGVGFWDRKGLLGPALGDRLTDLTDSWFNEVYAYPQDGKVVVDGCGIKLSKQRKED